jgi:hypothetical protein
LKPIVPAQEFAATGNDFLTIWRDKAGMDASISTFFGLFAKVGLALLLANEVRGAVIAAPVFYGMYQAGGTLMALWLGICSLAGIALSVVAPMFLARRLALI